MSSRIKTLSGLMAGLVMLSIGWSAIPAHAASTYPTLSTANVRSEPTTDSLIVTVLPKGSSIAIDCYAEGQYVNGTSIWNHTSYGWISDSLLLTGSDLPDVPACDSQSPTAQESDAAAPDCYSVGCTGLDPDLTNCIDDVVTLQSVEARPQNAASDRSLGVLELRYSEKCHANWSRFTPWGGARNVLGYLLGGTVFGQPSIWPENDSASAEHQLGQSSPAGWTQSVWTGMISADGTTCSSVETSYQEKSSSGQGERYPNGTFTAPCVS